MNPADDERRAADRWMRDKVSERLVAIETSQKLYHDEIKSITEGLHNQIASVSIDVKTLNRVVFGGEAPGILENIRGLMWKFGIATSMAVAIIGGGLKLFSPALNKLAMKMLGEGPEAQFQMQGKKKRFQFYNKDTGKYEYYIQFQPVGVKEGARAQQ